MKKRGGRSAQVSLEFSIILGFATLMIIPTIIVFYTQTQETNNIFAIRQAERIARQIVDEAEIVYYTGTPSKSMLKVYIPKNVKAINLSNNEVVITIEISGSLSEIAVPCRVNITGSVNPQQGFKYLKFEAYNSSVVVSS
ncbi:MAG: hypothetical protein QXW00_01805 [Candidatus Woesearchaeota archaeon]